MDHYSQVTQASLGTSARAVSDSIFDEFRERAVQMERQVRELAGVLADRNNRLFGVDGPPSAPPLAASSATVPVGPLTSELTNALINLGDAIDSASYQVHRQSQLG